MSYYIASVSCGNDSMAMLYELIRRKYPLDEVVFYTNGKDFDCIYNLWNKVVALCGENGIKTAILTPECDFDEKMFNIKVKNRDGTGYHNGYSWCGGPCRWGTTDKQKILDKYCEGKSATVYIGIAADETNRTPDKPYKIHPLKEFGYTEKDCKEINGKNGVEWLEWSETLNDYINLYDILDRVSCWCCANKNQWELYNIWRYLPNYWDKLKGLQTKLTRPFKSGDCGYSIFEIEKRFENGFVPKHRKA